MPTYTIEGKRIKTDAPLSDADIDEIAASLKATVTKPEPTPEGTITSGYLMGLKDPITAGAQMLPRGLEFATSLGGTTPNVLSRFFGKEAARVDEMARAEEAAYQQARAAQGEEGFDWTRLAGNVVNPANIAAGAGTARLLGAAKPLTQAIATGAVGGALQPVVGEEGTFGEQKAQQAVTGAAGGVLGLGATKIAGKVLNPLVSKAEQTMRDLGVTLTPGQLMGKQAKGLEEFAQNMPLVGSYIGQAKERQLFQFNQGVINKALSKVNEKLPADVIGRDAVAEAENIISKQYDDVLSKINFKLDQNTQASLGAVVRTSKLTGAAEKQKLNDLINDYIYAKIPLDPKTKTGSINGPLFKGIESDLLKRVRSLKSSATDADRTLGDELAKALDVFKANMRSQNPTQSSVLRRIDSAYGDLAVMRTAAANTGAQNGVFTPKQYQTAVRQRDISRNKTAFAAGRARGQETAEAAMETISPEIGSTLEGRLALGLGGYGAIQQPAVAAGIAVASPLLYSDQGLKVMQALLRNRPDVARRIGAILTSRASKEGSITGAQVLEEYNRSTKTKE
jgi:hypothetical protein